MNLLTAHRARKRAQARATAPASMSFAQGLGVNAQLHLMETKLDRVIDQVHQTYRTVQTINAHLPKESPWT